MLISPAYAQAAGDGGGEAGLLSLLPLVLIFVIFWFLLIRPQQKKMKAHKSMVEALRRGDKVVTGGGVFGTVSKILNENEVQVEIAENVRIKVVRQTIQEVLRKPQPADGKGGEGASSEDKGPANDPGGGPKKGGGLLGGLLGGRK
jgi:preprotein translocase subunit YajC